MQWARIHLISSALASAVAAIAAGSAIASCESDETVNPRDFPVPPSDASVDAPKDALADVATGDADAASDADADASEGGGPIISETADSTYEGETQVAVAPDGTIGVAWIATPFADSLPRVGYRFSKDNGVSWSSIRLVPNGTGTYSGDPSIATAANGDFYIGWLPIDLDGVTILGTHVLVGRVPARARARRNLQRGRSRAEVDEMVKTAIAAGRRDRRYHRGEERLVNGVLADRMSELSGRGLRQPVCQWSDGAFPLASRGEV